jgi:hypothetical protein
MAAAVTKGNERDEQYKIHQLEETLIKLFPNVNDRKKVTNEHNENMMETSRVKKKDGFYMFSVDKEEESHGILLYKETQSDGKIIFYVYEPNGKKSFNEDYQLSVTSKQSFEFNLDMSPDKSINEDGNCAVWCIVVIILWNSFRPEDRWTALNLFNTKMREKYEVRKQFIDGIVQLIRRFSDFGSLPITRKFVAEVRTRIFDLPILLPDSFF